MTIQEAREKDIKFLREPDWPRGHVIVLLKDNKIQLYERYPAYTKTLDDRDMPSDTFVEYPIEVKHG